MGLSQLYQLRGRVGRSNRAAYAYLTYHRDKILSDIASKRLRAVKEFTEFGSGFKIAMRDLEIRGAGNILGPEQHGHMDAVGYDMYCKLLKESVDEAQGIKIDDVQDVAIDINIDAYLPESYIETTINVLIYTRKSRQSKRRTISLKSRTNLSTDSVIYREPYKILSKLRTLKNVLTKNVVY